MLQIREDTLRQASIKITSIYYEPDPTCTAALNSQNNLMTQVKRNNLINKR